MAQGERADVVYTQTCVLTIEQTAASGQIVQGQLFGGLKRLDEGLRPYKDV